MGNQDAVENLLSNVMAACGHEYCNVLSGNKDPARAYECNPANVVLEFFKRKLGYVRRNS